MKNTNLLFLAFMAFSTPFSALSQTFQFPTQDFGVAIEKNLGLPNTSEGSQVVPVGIDLWEGDQVNTIHYGLTPANSSTKPVIVFVHGYAANAEVWFKGDDNMYADVYRDGYRSAFVSLAPNKHIWTNGQMLSRMIAQVTKRYGVTKVVLVGWSKGGVDVDAAITHYGAHARVSRAFTLSTPHHGTAIAELANSVLLTFVNIIFMQNNDGTKSLQRGYMDYFRSITDGSVNNKVAYTTLGGWGSGPLARLNVPQELLHWNGGGRNTGGNDGVVPYISSKRPGGRSLFTGQYWNGLFYTGPSQTNLDHFEVTRGGKVWPHIKANLGTTARVDMASEEVANDFNPNAEISSNMQVMSAMRGSKSFFVEPNSGPVQIIVGLNAASSSAMRLSNSNGQPVVTSQPINERTDQVNKQVYTLDKLAPGRYEITFDEPFVAVVMASNGITAKLNTGLNGQKRVYETGESMALTLNLANEAGAQISNAQVTGLATRVTGLDATAIDESPVPVSFTWKDGRFESNWSGATKPGIYSFTINAQGQGFQKTVITSLAVVGEEKKSLEAGSVEIASAYPNPFTSTLGIDIDAKGAKTVLTIYNIHGQEVKRFELLEGKQTVQWNAQEEGMEAGLYILQLTDGLNKTSKKVVLK